MSRPAEAFVAEAAGLEASTLGAGTLDAAVAERCAALDTDETGLVERLRRDPAEAEAFLSHLLVHETWLFRDRLPFELLESLAARRARARSLPLRVLCFPCATGEEAWSIAATLLHAGLAPGDFGVLACDIEPRALAVARRGLYPRRAFRGNEEVGPARRFRPRTGDDGEDLVEAPPEARTSVEFRRMNLLDAGELATSGPFDAVFCRNALVYMGRPARRRVVAALRTLLAPGGLLVVGHSEVPTLLALGFEPVGPPGAFAVTPADGRATAGDPGAAARTAATPARKPPRREPPRVPVAAPAAAGATGVPRRPTGGPATAQATRPAAAASRPADRGDRDPAADGTALLGEARRLADAGRIDEAGRLVRDVLERTPTSAEAHLLHGVLLVAERREGEARLALERAVYLDPSCEEALVHLAAIADRAGDRPAAERLRARAARIEARS